MDNSNKILIAEVRKKSKFENNEIWYRTSFVSYDKNKLENKIKIHYGIKLDKDEKNDFPYFTDGGFKYNSENENWIFEIEAHSYDII